MAASNTAKRLMIFGGTGFVGSAIAREAAKRGLLVQCVTRGGDAPAHLKDEPWASSVTWLRGDALDPSSYKEHMRGADAVITSVGRLPFPNLSHEDIVRDNGETNVTPAKCAKEVGVDRLVVIGASVPPIPGVGWGISPTSGVYAAGYAAGKAMAEVHARDEFVGAGHGGRGAAVLKPGPVSGEFIFICSAKSYMRN
jgi:nucleoside-diphosphate-sugar epimerase